jgi:serine O-acetyltransferase
MTFREMCTLVREDYQGYGDWSKPGFRATLLHRIANWRLGLPRVFRYPIWLFYKSAQHWIRNHYGIDLTYTVKLGRRVVLGNQGNIAIHPLAIIGDDCIIRQNVSIGALRGDKFEEAPSLGKGVEIGAGAVIVGRVKIGDNARIGPNVVLFSNVPANSMVMPAAGRIVPLPTSRSASA